MSELTEITPDGSVSPVFADPTPPAPMEGPDPAELEQQYSDLRMSGMEKLIAGKPLSPPEARVMMGLPLE